MTDATEARSLALQLLLRLEAASATPAELLAGSALGGLPPRERDLVHELVLGTLRRRGWIDYALGRVLDRPLGDVDAGLRAVLRLGAHQILHMRVPAHAAVYQSVALARERQPRAAGFVNAVLRRLAREGAPRAPDPETEPREWLISAGSLPSWLAERWLEGLGPAAALARARAFLETPATTFRLNPRRPEAARQLEAAGAVVHPAAVPGALHLDSGRLHALAEAGLVYVQDEGSQLVAQLTARPGRLLDACAAPGGKSALMADLLPASHVIACEPSAARAGTLARLLRRWGADNVRCVRADATRPPFRACFDAVLLDAPCSGLGTLGRNPDVRWRAREADLSRHASKQRALLESLAPQLVAGGRLVYSVCSLEPEEAERVVEPFLLAHPEFRPVPPPPWAARFAEDRFLRMRPEAHGGDGFFVALLERG